MRMIGAQAIILAIVMALCGRVDQASPRLAEDPALEAQRIPSPLDQILEPVSRKSTEELIATVAASPNIEGSDAAAQLVVATQTDPNVVLQLISRLDERKGRPAILATLSRVGPSVIEHLPALLKDESAEVRWSALRLLLSLDEVPVSMTPCVAKLLRDDDIWVRRWAVMVLSRTNDSSCDDVLIEACSDSDAEVRWRALRTLQSRQDWSRTIPSTLDNAMNDPDPDVRLVAREARTRFQKDRVHPDE